MKERRRRKAQRQYCLFQPSADKMKFFMIQKRMNVWFTLNTGSAMMENTNDT